MKAKIQTGLLLTVGMIVKNEEKHLPNCLKAVQRLLDQIPGELIIADTGSTDDTVEIAKEFTDQVFHFDWCDDFAAARNAVLDRAKGQWYLSIDADEYLDEDITELVDFLKSSQRKYYNIATIKIRSYTEERNSETFSEFRAMRLCRRASGSRFTGKIHESLVGMAPIKMLDTVAHHYGYVFQDEEAVAEKRSRNLALILQELEEKPEDLRTIVQVAESCFKNGQELEYLERGMEVVRRSDPGPIGIRCAFLLMSCHVNQKRPEDAIAVGNELLELYEKKWESVLYQDIYSSLILLNTQLQHLEEAVECYKKYEKHLRRVQSGEISSIDLLFATLDSDTPQARLQIRQYMIQAAVSLEDHDTLMLALSNIDLNEIPPQEFANMVNTVLTLVKRLSRADAILLIYKEAQKWKDSDESIDSVKWSILTAVMENFYLKNPETRERLATESLSAANELQEDAFLWAMRLAAMENAPDFEAALGEFISGPCQWDCAWAIVYYFVLKHRLRFPAEALLVNETRLEIVLGNLACCYPDFAGVLLDYNRAVQPQGLFLQKFMMTAFEKALLAYKNGEDGDLKQRLIDAAAGCTYQYMLSVYQPNLLSAEQIGVLPPFYQFAFFYKLAGDCLGQGDELGYIRNLRAPLSRNKHMTDLVNLINFVIERHERIKQEEQSAFQQLAVSFKQKAQSLVEMGLLTEAHMLLEKYLCLCPDDQDAAALLQRVGVPPTGPVS